MGPLWFEQGTFSHDLFSDLLSIDVLVSPLGAPVGAGQETIVYDTQCVIVSSQLVYHSCIKLRICHNIHVMV